MKRESVIQKREYVLDNRRVFSGRLLVQTQRVFCNVYIPNFYLLLQPLLQRAPECECLHLPTNLFHFMVLQVLPITDQITELSLHVSLMLNNQTIFDVFIYLFAKRYCRLFLQGINWVLLLRNFLIDDQQIVCILRIICYYLHSVISFFM